MTDAQSMQPRGTTTAESPPAVIDPRASAETVETPHEPAGDSIAPLVFFDGVCGLCNRFVDFVLTRDARGIFRFAPLQGETARGRLTESDIRDLASIVVLDERGKHRKSAAVARVLWRLGGAWRVLATLLWLVPRPVRDAGYSVVARYRYSVFGKKEACRLPTSSERPRFLL